MCKSHLHTSMLSKLTYFGIKLLMAAIYCSSIMVLPTCYQKNMHTYKQMFYSSYNKSNLSIDNNNLYNYLYKRLMVGSFQNVYKNHKWILYGHFQLYNYNF